MVLLKNDGVLPFEKGKRVAVFGKAQIDWINAVQACIPTKYEVSLLDALEGAQKNGEIYVFDQLAAFYKDYFEKQMEDIEEYNRTAVEKAKSAKNIEEPQLPAALLDKAAEFADTAIIVVCRRGGENNDRQPEDFELTKRERAMIDSVCKKFENVVALLNIGAPMETDWIKENHRLGGRFSRVIPVWRAEMQCATYCWAR